jgi:hypothetical protein
MDFQRLTCRKLLVLAAGVKSPSSDLFESKHAAVKIGIRETNCQRRWSPLAGGGLLGWHRLAVELVARRRSRADKKSINDVEEETPKAARALKKGPEAKKEKEEKPPVDLNLIDLAARPKRR